MPLFCDLLSSFSDRRSTTREDGPETVDQYASGDPTQHIPCGPLEPPAFSTRVASGQTRSVLPYNASASSSDSSFFRMQNNKFYRIPPGPGFGGAGQALAPQSTRSDHLGDLCPVGEALFASPPPDSPLGVWSRSEPVTRGTGCVNCARPGLWEPGASNRPGPPGQQPPKVYPVCNSTAAFQRKTRYSENQEIPEKNRPSEGCPQDNLGLHNRRGSTIR